MPRLEWSASALAAVPEESKRKEINRLFDSYFRVAGRDQLQQSLLYLDLEKDAKNRYHLHARFTPNRGWIVHAQLKYQYRTLV